jgi:hypothetical protein
MTFRLVAVLPAGVALGGRGATGSRSSRARAGAAGSRGGAAGSGGSLRACSAGTGAGIVSGRIRASIVGGRAVIVGIVGGRIRGRAPTRAITRTSGSAGLDVDARIRAIGGGIAATRTDDSAGPDFAVRIGAVGGDGTAATRTLTCAGPDLAVRIGTVGGSGRVAGRRGPGATSSGRRRALCRRLFRAACLNDILGGLAPSGIQVANFKPKHGERERCTDRIGENNHPIVFRNAVDHPKA